MAAPSVGEPAETHRLSRRLREPLRRNPTRAHAALVWRHARPFAADSSMSINGRVFSSPSPRSDNGGAGRPAGRSRKQERVSCIPRASGRNIPSPPNLSLTTPPPGALSLLPSMKIEESLRVWEEYKRNLLTASSAPWRATFVEGLPYVLMGRRTE